MSIAIIPTLKLVTALLTAIFGIVALLRPQQTAEAASLSADTPAGQAEIRASWGGLFLGLAIAVMVLQSYEAYLVFASAYALTAIVRMLTWANNSDLITRTAIIIFCFEVFSAIVFALPENLL